MSLLYWLVSRYDEKTRVPPTHEYKQEQKKKFLVLTHKAEAYLTTSSLFSDFSTAKSFHYKYICKVKKGLTCFRH